MASRNSYSDERIHFLKQEISFFNLSAPENNIRRILPYFYNFEFKNIRPDMLKDLIQKNRSYRRFYEDETISVDQLKEMVDNARLSASGRNIQSLKYILSNTPEINGKIFSCLAWAGYLKEWPGPEEGERPSAYIVMVNDRNITESYLWDHGIAVQSILLTAVEKGFGGCIIASVNKEMLRSVLDIDPQYDIIQVVALGKPKETVVIDELPANGDIKYWRDAQSVHHVPKRKLDDVIIKVVKH
jgi:nitroreductase